MRIDRSDNNKINQRIHAVNRDFAHLRSRLAIVLLAVALILMYVAFPGALYGGIERNAYDALVRLSPPIPQEERVVIVDIDERSLARYGAWPWPRATVAKLVSELLGRHQVGLLGLDIVFPLRREGDRLLREALDQPNVVMSQTLDFAAISDNHVGALADRVEVRGRRHAPQAGGYVANDSGVLPPNAAVGHISPVIDDDGHIRRIYPVACAGDACTMTFALRMYAQLTAAGHGTPRVDYLDGGARLHVDLRDDEPLDLPLDAQHAWIVPYRVASGGFPVVSAAEVMDGSQALPWLENSIVLVGSSALGIGDRVATPLTKLAPGVEVHAQLLTALLDRSFIRPLPVSAPLFLMLAAVILASYLGWPGRGRSLLLGWPPLALAAAVMLLAWALLAQGLLLPLTPLPLLVLLIGALTMLQQNFALTARVRTIGLQFSQFLPASLVGRLLRDKQIGPETERHMMTVLIVDVRGFTAASEDKTPEQIAGFAQKCFEVLSAEVARYQGTIEKYTGDGLMALWGVPTENVSAQPTPPLRIRAATRARRSGIDLAHARYAAQAVSAALAMQQAIDALAGWFEQHGYPQLQLSIGLNTGPMSVGVFGGQTHLAWSAQGQAFNVASRIESLTREVGEHLLMGEETALLLAEELVDKIGDYPVKGVSAPVAVYALRQAHDRHPTYRISGMRG